MTETHDDLIWLVTCRLGMHCKWLPRAVLDTSCRCTAMAALLVSINNIIAERSIPSNNIMECNYKLTVVGCGVKEA